MEIISLIDRKFITTSILEDTRDAALYLKDHYYLAVANEDNYVVGILTRKDLLEQPDSRNILDCNIEKPILSPYDNTFDAFKVMHETGNDFLPVYLENNFIGIISLVSVTCQLVKDLTGNDNIIENKE